MNVEKTPIIDYHEIQKEKHYAELKKLQLSNDGFIVKQFTEKFVSAATKVISYRNKSIIFQQIT